jgi:hypothetical protein
MNNTTIQIKIKERLNKLASNDYDNIQTWQIVEAFNKGQVFWCRRNLQGLNATRQGDEASKRRIDDLQILLTDTPVQATTTYDKYVTVGTGLPADYLEWKRIDADASNDCCPGKRPLVIYLAEEGNVAQLLRDYNKKPSFEWAETFATIKDNFIRIYTNGEFNVEDAILTYYRQPRGIQFAGVTDPYTLVTPAADVECEFKDDIAEILCDEAARVIAGDTENFGQIQRISSTIEQNN